MRRAVSVLLLAVLVTPAAAGQQPLAGLDAYISKSIHDWKTPGLAIAVVKDGEVVFAHGYGVRESGKPAPVDTRTLFAIGSTTKAMTAALVGMLVDEKKVDWDAPVITYLPWFQLKDPAVSREVTVRDLLTHRAGLGNADYVLGNRDHTELRHALMYTVFDRYAGRSDHDWSAEFLKLYTGLQSEADEERAKKEARRVSGTTASLPVRRFAGDYSDPLHGDVQVTDDAGGLGIRYGAAFVGTLEHWHFNTFRATWKAFWRAPELVNFVLDSDGEPATLEMMGARFSRKPADRK